MDYMADKKILILGGGLAGATSAYLLKKKNYQVSVVEKDKHVGGLCRTRYYAGHPYEFGPHIFFWPHDDVIELLKEVAGELIPIERRLFSYIEKEDQLYRYPIHHADIERMPDKEEVYQQLSERNGKEWPTIGECTFEDYFRVAVGDNLYEKFMQQYTWKMWGIPGKELQTSLIWADRVGSDEKYDPIKYEDHTLGKGNFQVYPKDGWNPVFQNLLKDVELIRDTIYHIDKDSKGYYMRSEKTKYYFDDYYAVINTLDIDHLFGENTLRYMGRIIIPFLLKGIGWAFPAGVESIHYSGCEFVTRTTEMKRITGYQSPDTLILLEIPIFPTDKIPFTENVLQDGNYCARAYPVQDRESLERHRSYLDRSKEFSNLFHVGRSAQFKYFGMAETMDSALKLVKNNF